MLMVAALTTEVGCVVAEGRLMVAVPAAKGVEVTQKMEDVAVTFLAVEEAT